MFRQLSQISLSFLLCFVFSAFSGSFAHAAVFGVDNRHLITEKSPVRLEANATAIAVLSSNYKINAAGRIDLDAGELSNLCKDEPMATEPSLDYACTGFLVAPDLLVTAGHCVFAVNSPTQELRHESHLACESFAWLFDYQSTSTSTSTSSAQLKNIGADHLFHCKEIVFATQTEKAPFLDYALIRLDRPALGRLPFQLRTSAVGPADSLAMIGYPFGTPAKYTDDAQVTINQLKRDSFLTSLDALEGNSGSPVFDSSKRVVGILIGGTPSANTYKTKSGCERVNHCTEDASRCNAVDANTSIFPGYQGVGSEVQRIQPIIELLKKM